jgi:Ca-activated chloride channel family protein
LGANESGASGLPVQNQSGHRAEIPLVDEELRVTIDQQHAHTVMRHIYENDRGEQLEGSMTMRFGEASNIDSFAYWNGEQKIVGEVLEKAAATAVYEETVRGRKDPGLLVDNGDGSYSFKIFPIAPSERKRLEIGVDRWLPRSNGTIEYRMPVLSQRAAVEVRIDDERGVRNLRSPSHELEIVASSNRRVRVRARRMKRARAKSSTREFVLRYDVNDKPWHVHASVQRGKGKHSYVAVSLAAPRNLPQTAVVAKDLTIVLDRSGSMAGETMRAARAAAIGVVERVGPEDHLNVLAFDDSVDSLFREPKKATKAVKNQALDFIDDIYDGGGTNLALALERAYERQTKQSARPKVVLFLTDGESSPGPVLRQIRDADADVRVFTVGVGDSIDQPLLSRIARMERGRFVHIPNAEHLETRLSDLYRSIAEPVLVDLSLEVEGATMTRQYPDTLPDLFRGSELKISARLKGTGKAKLILRGNRAGSPVVLVKEVNLDRKASRPWVGELWARSRVDHLLEEIALHGEGPELRRETLDLALRYDVVTPYTAFLAIPESELTARTKQMLDRARGQKGAAKGGRGKQSADVDCLLSPDSCRTYAKRKSTNRSAELGTQFKSEAAQPSMPQPSFSVDSLGAGPERDLSTDRSFDEAEDAPILSSRRGERAETADAEAPGRSSARGGCAHCSAGGDVGGWPLGLLGLLGLLWWRRPYASA